MTALSSPEFENFLLICLEQTKTPSRLFENFSPLLDEIIKTDFKKLADISWLESFITKTRTMLNEQQQNHLDVVAFCLKADRKPKEILFRNYFTAEELAKIMAFVSNASSDNSLKKYITSFFLPKINDAAQISAGKTAPLYSSPLEENDTKSVLLAIFNNLSKEAAAPNESLKDDKSEVGEEETPPEKNKGINETTLALRFLLTAAVLPVLAPQLIFAAALLIFAPKRPSPKSFI
jgi:hypothetical protein